MVVVARDLRRISAIVTTSVATSDSAIRGHADIAATLETHDERLPAAHRAPLAHIEDAHRASVIVKLNFGHRQKPRLFADLLRSRDLAFRRNAHVVSFPYWY